MGTHNFIRAGIFLDNYYANHPRLDWRPSIVLNLFPELVSLAIWCLDCWVGVCVTDAIPPNQISSLQFRTTAPEVQFRAILLLFPDVVCLEFGRSLVRKTRALQTSRHRALHELPRNLSLLREDPMVFLPRLRHIHMTQVYFNDKSLASLAHLLSTR
jgi:hypothetical protein